jgi:hypothetical protein
MTEAEIVARLAWLADLLKQLQRPKPTTKETRH